MKIEIEKYKTGRYSKPKTKSEKINTDNRNRNRNRKKYLRFQARFLVNISKFIIFEGLSAKV